MDAVAAAPKERREEVRLNLPCDVCPEQERCLTAKEVEVTSILFDREYGTSPRGDTSSLFSRARLEEKRIIRPDLALIEYYRKPKGIESRYLVGSGWDFAWSEKAGGDWLAKVTARLDRQNGEIQVLDINRWQRLSFQEQCELIEEEWGRYNDDLVVMEEEAAGVIWAQYMSATTRVPVVRHDMGAKKDLTDGIPGILIDVERSKLLIPYQAGTWNHDNAQQFLSELEHFGWSGDKLEGVGEHDDTVDAFYHCWWGLKRFGSPKLSDSEKARRKRAAQEGRGAEI